MTNTNVDGRRSSSVATEAPSRTTASEVGGKNVDEQRTAVISVLLVDDHMLLREGLRQLFQLEEDIQVVGEATDGLEAMQKIRKLQPDVVLMDINLPGMNGAECVRRLKPLLPKGQFMMLTVYEDSDHIFQALQAGAAGYLLKQTHRADLLSALRDVYEGGSPMTANIARKVVQCFHSQPRTEGNETLSPRESEVLELLARGYLYKEIADSLNISLPTVNTYIRRVYEKLHVRSRSQAVANLSRFPVSGEASRSATPS